MKKAILFFGTNATNNQIPTTGGVYVVKQKDGTFTFQWEFPGKEAKDVHFVTADGVTLVNKKTTETPEGNLLVTGTLQITKKTTGATRAIARFGIKTIKDGVTRKYDALVLENSNSTLVGVGLKEVAENRSIKTMAEDFTNNNTQNYQNLVNSLTDDAFQNTSTIYNQVPVQETATA